MSAWFSVKPTGGEALRLELHTNMYIAHTKAHTKLVVLI